MCRSTRIASAVLARAILSLYHKLVLCPNTLLDPQYCDILWKDIPSSFLQTKHDSSGSTYCMWNSAQNYPPRTNSTIFSRISYYISHVIDRRKKLTIACNSKEMKEEIFAYQLACYVIMTTFSVAVQWATSRNISCTDIEAKLSIVLADASRAFGSLLHNIWTVTLFSQIICN